MIDGDRHDMINGFSALYEVLDGLYSLLGVNVCLLSFLTTSSWGMSSIYLTERLGLQEHI